MNHKLWSAKLLATKPGAIIQAHRAYLEAGAQCIITSSYQASIQGFLNAGYDTITAEKLLLKTVSLAEMAVEQYMKTSKNSLSPLIAASIGPYGAYLADGSEYRGDYNISEAELKDFHLERIKLLDKSNADLFACETIPSYQEAKVLSEILKQTTKPAWVTFSCKDATHINDGTKIQDCVALFKNHLNVFAFGVNCTAPEHISGLIKTIKSTSWNKKIVIYPNSGLVYNPISKTWQGLASPQAFVEKAKEWVNLGADIIGGCCQIGPKHIASIYDCFHQ